MDDQFGGRTDDDLFADDFEPIGDFEAPPVNETPVYQHHTSTSTPASTAPAPVKVPEPAPAPSKAPVAPARDTQAPVETRPLRKGLAHSKYNDKKPQSPQPSKPAPAATPEVIADAPPPSASPAGPGPAPAPAAPTATAAAPATATAPSATPASAATPVSAVTPASAATPTSETPATASPRDASTPAPREGKQGGGGSFTPGSNTALKAEVRAKSGANPRQKLTDEELTARMEQMKLKNAERTRKFERAEADQRTHDQSVARGIEEARKKKIADEERRRRGEEDRKKMDDERAKNRERKLRAMEHKDGGWDRGKLEEQDDSRDFRGASGGVRGARGIETLAGSRYAREDRDNDHDAGDSYRGRGRGQGRGRGTPGRGRGRGGALTPSNGADPAPAQEKPVLTKLDFPALPGADLIGSPLGNTTWGDEMDALDEKLAKEK